MIDLNLDIDEGIILESNDVHWVGNERMSLQQLTLTNKSLYLVCKKKNGVFAKATDELIQKPLEDIKIINGRPMVDQVRNDNHDVCIQIQFVQGREQFVFVFSPKKNSAIWVNAFWRILVGTDAPAMQQSGLFSGTPKKVQTVSQMMMGTCVNCGKKLSLGAKFCPECGASAGVSAPIVNVSPNSSINTVNYETRQQEFAGKIIKCPACGTEIPSLTAICPGCGHEINSAGVSSAFKYFTEQISQCDTAIADGLAEPKKGWKSWSIMKKTAWIILNLFTLCVPLLIYLVLPLLNIGTISSLTPEEQRKANVINDFTFPNERESILEGLLYIKSQMAVLAFGKIDHNTARWIRIWKNKASQLYEKAEILFEDDKIVADAYADILASEKKVRKSLLIRFVAVVVFVLLFVVLLFSRNASGHVTEKSVATFEWPSSGLALQLPMPPSNTGKITINDDNAFWLSVSNVNQTQYEKYITACKEKGFTIESKKDAFMYEAYNEDGYQLSMTHLSSGNKLTIIVNAPEPMGDIQWPKSEIAKRLPMPKLLYGKIEWENDNGFVIYLGNATKQDFLEYVDACYEAGFSDNYQKGDTYFRADDAEGYHVDIQYRGNDVMFIRIDDPKNREG